MSKKSSKKGRQVPSRQQQQQDAAARRRLQPGGGTSGGTVPQPRTSASPGPAATAASAGKATGREPVRYYLDVSAVRIQEWLARTPDLRCRRGASVMLSEATGEDAWPPGRLPAQLEWNPEAGDLDGVISLRTNSSVTAADAPGILAAAARQVARGIRDELPFCALHAVAGFGTSYAEVYKIMERARRDGDFLVDAPAPPAELILAKPCDRCRAAPAQHRGVEIVDRAKAEDLCGECDQRVRAAGGTKGSWEVRSPRPERRLKASLAAAGWDVTFPDDFRNLAEIGHRPGESGAATQLALIFADGNRVGAFLAEAADCARRLGRPGKAEIVPALDGATRDALADAVTSCYAGLRRPGVMVHVAGGDDLMVSVSARYAWPFVRALLGAFPKRLAAAADWPDKLLGQLPSLSAGLVFHHQSAPFPDVVRLAHDQLRTAKQATARNEPSVAFLDVTADGEYAPPGRVPLALSGLNRLAGRLGQIAAIPASHRENLLALLRLDAAGSATNGVGARGETPAEALARRVADLGYLPLWEHVAGPGVGAEHVQSALADPANRAELRRILDLARWWPPAEDPASPAAPALPGQRRDSTVEVRA